MKHTIRDLSFKYSVEKPMVEAVVNSAYTFLRNLLSNEDMSSLRMPKLGLFIVKPHRRIDYENFMEKNGGVHQYKVLEGSDEGLVQLPVQKGQGGDSSQEAGENMQQVSTK